MIDRCILTTLLACALPGTACKKNAVESYRVPKETVAQEPVTSRDASTNTKGGAVPAASAAPAASGNPMANTAVATAGGPGLTWTAPAHWSSKPASAMRKGTYAIKAEGIAGEGDLSITAFPGDVGGELANINRWRGQLQLPPITQAQLESGTEHVDRNNLHMTVVDIAGTGANAQRILGAIVPHAGATWFFKLIGPDALVAKEKASFMSFLETVKPGGPAK